MSGRGQALEMSGDGPRPEMWVRARPLEMSAPGLQPARVQLPGMSARDPRPRSPQAGAVPPAAAPSTGVAVAAAPGHPAVEDHRVAAAADTVAVAEDEEEEEDGDEIRTKS